MAQLALCRWLLAFHLLAGRAAVVPVTPTPVADAPRPRPCPACGVGHLVRVAVLARGDVVGVPCDSS